MNGSTGDASEVREALETVSSRTQVRFPVNAYENNCVECGTHLLVNEGYRTARRNKYGGKTWVTLCVEHALAEMLEQEQLNKTCPPRWVLDPSNPGDPRSNTRTGNCAVCSIEVVPEAGVLAKGYRDGEPVNNQWSVLCANCQSEAYTDPTETINHREPLEPVPFTVNVTRRKVDRIPFLISPYTFEVECLWDETTIRRVGVLAAVTGDISVVDKASSALRAALEYVRRKHGVGDPGYRRSPGERIATPNENEPQDCCPPVSMATLPSDVKAHFRSYKHICTKYGAEEPLTKRLVKLLEKDEYVPLISSNPHRF